MLCSKCYKKIPEGEEVHRGGSGIYWRAGYWAGEGGKSGVFCRQCAKKEEKRERKLWVAFISIFIFIVLFFFFSVIYVFWLKER